MNSFLGLTAFKRLGHFPREVEIIDLVVYTGVTLALACVAFTCQRYQY
jgi:hypothetical protein